MISWPASDQPTRLPADLLAELAGQRALVALSDLAYCVALTAEGVNVTQLCLSQPTADHALELAWEDGRPTAELRPVIGNLETFSAPRAFDAVFIEAPDQEGDLSGLVSQGAVSVRPGGRLLIIPRSDGTIAPPESLASLLSLDELVVERWWAVNGRPGVALVKHSTDRAHAMSVVLAQQALAVERLDRVLDLTRRHLVERDAALAQLQRSVRDLALASQRFEPRESDLDRLETSLGESSSLMEEQLVALEKLRTETGALITSVSAQGEDSS